MAFDPDAHLDDGQDHFDPDTHLEGASESASAPSFSRLQVVGDIATRDNPVSQYVLHAGSSLSANAAAGAHAVYDAVTGKVTNIHDARVKADQYVKEHTYTAPENSGGEMLTKASESSFNPMNWPGLLLKESGKANQWSLEKLGVPSQYSTLAGAGTEAGGNVALGAYGASKALGFGGKPAVEPSAAPAEAPGPSGWTRAAPSAAPADPAVASEPVEGGVTESASTPIGRGRAEVLRRIGLEHARESALTGDAQRGATDYQMKKFDEPAGAAATAQFDAERAALEGHAERIVKNTGGTLGMDEDSLHARGQTIAAPFDALRKWFADKKNQMYAQADARAQGQPIGNLDTVDALLKDPDFRETLLAKDQGGLLGSIERQYARFKELNPNGFTVENAENFRKWLNQIWTKDNSSTLGKVKGAIDEGVFSKVGEDIYGPARQLHQVESQLLDNPNGISGIFDFDPKNPLNRATPHAQIPNEISRLDPANFKNVLDTLKNMPEEVQPQAQSAIAEIKAHFANKLLEAGSKFQGQWNSGGVSKLLKANSAKITEAFGDDPASMSMIHDLDAAGKILKVDASYPGAAAQAANAVKRGLMSHAISKGTAATGALVGSALGPFGSAAGAAAGEFAGGKLGASVAEKQALGRWLKGTKTLSEIVNPGKPK